MSLTNFRIKDFDDETVDIKPVTQYSYESDCLDFIPLRAGKTTRYMSVARDSVAIDIPVWVAEPTRRTIIEEVDVPVRTGRIIPVFAA
jgi:hypothetical protein